jgi:multiple sugar transport system permease protein
MRRPGSTILLQAALALGAAATLAPLAWMVSASLMPSGEANAFPPRFLPSRATLEHYVVLFTRLDLARHFLNSAIITVSVTVLSVLINSMAGYAFAKLRFRGRDRLFAALLVTLVVPAQVGVLPLYLELRALGLVNSYLGVIVAGIATVFGIFLVRQFALSIPDDLIDAARVDGASEWRIYRRIVLPLLRPILVTLGVFTFLSAWNDFMWPLIVLTDQSRHTLPVALANLSGEHVQDTELMMAGAVVTVLPVVVLFLAVQRHYLEGILLGSVKE